MDESGVLYVALCCFVLFLPAPFVVPGDGENTVEMYCLYPATGPIVWVSVETWSSLSELICAVFLAAVLICTAVLSYAWYRWTARLAPERRFNFRFALAIGLFVISLVQGALGFLLIHGLYGVMHS